MPNRKPKLIFKLKKKIKRNEYDDKFKESIDNPKKFRCNVNSLIYNKSDRKNDDIEIKNSSGKILKVIEAVEF